MQLPPGPAAPAALQAVPFWSRPLAFVERCRARYGTPFTIRLPFTPAFVMIADPAQIKEVFTAPPDVLHPGSGARVLAPLVGANSVILLDGDAHMSQRKLMLPAFHGEKMALLSDLVEEVTEREVAGWPRDEVVALHPLMQRLTLEIVLRAVFGLEPGARMDALRSQLETMLGFGDNPLSLIRFNEGTRPDRALRRVGPMARFFSLQAEADRLIAELIHERRGDSGERHDILAMLLAARHDSGEPMSDQEVRDELMTLLVAGHETTATSLAWAFNRLPAHPDVIAELRAEMATSGDAYVTATIQESLRRRPVLPNAAPRLVKQPIEVGGRAYPVDVCLVPNAYLVQHDPEIYPDPYAFRPQRFVDEAPGTYTWIPFGGGRRRCLGASFAMMEMKIVLRRLLATCDVESAAGIELPKRRNITITPGKGALTVLRARPGGAQRASAEALAEPVAVGQRDPAA